MKKLRNCIHRPRVRALLRGLPEEEYDADHVECQTAEGERIRCAHVFPSAYAVPRILACVKNRYLYSSGGQFLLSGKLNQEALRYQGAS